MQTIVAAVLLYFLVLPMVGGALAFLLGGLRARFSQAGKAYDGYHPLNPFYRLSPYHFGRSA
ncbi:hypothetical protein Ga0061063_0422 [Gulbenkiania indica]|uniref:Uncharacterized protein n=2 Tax=Gulbenkiania TaxID=397456 RepID=A0A0K6GSA7_9NEIS|nr:hypothetical protein [Gulbenkiania indica]TCW32310.1 hypothetical protein EV669_103226 [Gulbenkiania mobilis]CUA81580.1 hypothetical protein Ga0061063_0422 [Gulbenkiania indica]